MTLGRGCGIDGNWLDGKDEAPPRGDTESLSSSLQPFVSFFFWANVGNLILHLSPRSDTSLINSVLFVSSVLSKLLRLTVSSSCVAVSKREEAFTLKKRLSDTTDTFSYTLINFLSEILRLCARYERCCCWLGALNVVSEKLSKQQPSWQINPGVASCLWVLESRTGEGTKKAAQRHQWGRLGILTLK